jgi:RimJ/RimL family protein N-acetyltransferase
MITTGLWRLTHYDAPALAELLDSDVLQNCYLRSELRLGALSSGQWWGVGGGGRLRATLAGGPLIVPWVPDHEDCDRLAEALTRQPAPRMLVGPRDQVLALHSARQRPPEPREQRDPQPFLALQRGALRVRPSDEVRPGTPDDLERLTLAAADMHREEMGIDPLAIDPTGWRARMSTLIQRGWSWVWTEGDRVVFKAELSAWTPEAVQIQGVYTAPSVRNQGVATEGLAAVCAAVLRQVPVCTLYVNHYNSPARAVYDRLGFEHVADFATLFY